MNIIVAVDDKFGFSKNGGIPWKSGIDMKHFKNVTLHHVCIMGKNTFLSLGKPLIDRINIVVSKTLKTEHENVLIFPDYITAFNHAKNNYNKEIFCIGGLQMYKEALADKENLRKIYLTQIKGVYECDLCLNIDIYKHNQKILFSNEDLKITLLSGINESEENYLSLLKKILTEGELTETRNGKTYSLFAPADLKFDLREGFPLLTTKKMFWRAIVEELIMFINGGTDATYLSNKGIKIWEPNTTSDFIKSRGLDYEPGDMGPMYGWNWRHFSANYLGKDADYTNEGFDQLANLLYMIKHDLTNCKRRLLITTLDPSKVAQSVLPPCHSLPIQFNISGEYIDCKMTQRSADMFLGVPFNIASTALFHTLIGKVTGYLPRYLSLSLGDAHIYADHKDCILEQITRKPFMYPSIKIKKEIGNLIELENITFSDIELCEYVSHPAIKANMVA